MPTRNLCRQLARPTVAMMLGILGTTTTLGGDPPVITEHPQSQMVCEGTDITFAVLATGEELTYQWRKNELSIAGATSASLNLDACTSQDSGDYDCVVTNPYGEAISNTAVLVVDPGPQIVEQPQSEEVCEGTPVTLNVTVANEATCWIDQIGSTGSSGSGARMRANYYRADSTTTLTRIEQYLGISASGPLVFFVYEGDVLSGPYTLIAEDTVPASGTGTGYYSSGALSVPLEADQYYIIGAAWPDSHTYYWNASQPNTVTFGQSLHGFAYAWQDPLPDPPPTPINDFAYMQRLTTSELALSYQWRKDDESIPGAGGPQYTIASMSSEDPGDYDVVIINACGSATSDAATLTLGIGPSVTQDPSDCAVCLDEPATFTVTASGPDLTYQWRKDEADITGAASDTYLIDAATLADAGVYDVVVTNSCGVQFSAAATLLVSDAAPTIDDHPDGQHACQGEPVALAVSATGAGLQYQWWKDGQAIDGATSSTYELSSVEPNDAGIYEAVVSNPCGIATSDPASLEIDETLAIAAHPTGDLICQGDTFELSVVANGTGLSYQWRKNGEDIPDATADIYTIVSATLADSGDYDVVVANACGELTSNVATVTVVSGPAFSEHPADQQLESGQPLMLTASLDLSSFPDAVDTIGAPISFGATADKIRGNSYEVWETVTLTRIEHYLDITTPGALRFFVYEAEADEQGPYALIVDDALPSAGPGSGFFASQPLRVTLEAGKYYIIGAAWHGAHTYYWEPDGHPQPTAFGQSIHGYATTYQTQLPYAPTPVSTHAYHQRLTTVNEVASFQWRKDGVEIAGATDSTFMIAAVSFRHAGIYDLTAANDCGAATSDAAQVIVIDTEGPLLPFRNPKRTYTPLNDSLAP